MLARAPPTACCRARSPRVVAGGRAGASTRSTATIAPRSRRIAVEEGHFRSDLDLSQFAFEAYAIASGSHALSRLMRDETSERRARAAFERLVTDARRSPCRSA
ncbi:TetR family transcriptional regulator C-terminal domain-containing protein [Sorangium sp. So ce764]